MWFWQLARNALVDHYRKKSAIPFSRFEEDEVETMAVGEIPDVDTLISYRKLRSVIGMFSEEEQELFELRFAAEMSYKDIARVLGKPEGTLRVAALRLREKIYKEFRER